MWIFIASLLDRAGISTSEKGYDMPAKGYDMQAKGYYNSDLVL
jgi:hypothetical protein